jgi:hypothetical protein
MQRIWKSFQVPQFVGKYFRGSAISICWRALESYFSLETEKRGRRKCSSTWNGFFVWTCCLMCFLFSGTSRIFRFSLPVFTFREFQLWMETRECSWIKDLFYNQVCLLYNFLNVLTGSPEKLCKYGAVWRETLNQNRELSSEEFNLLCLSDWSCICEIYSRTKNIIVK